MGNNTTKSSQTKPSVETSSDEDSSVTACNSATENSQATDSSSDVTAEEADGDQLSTLAFPTYLNYEEVAELAAKSCLAEPSHADIGPAKTDPAETSPAETCPAETSQAETCPAETSPAETCPAETSQTETSQAETCPAKTSTAERPHAASCSGETGPAKTDLADNVSAETCPAKTNSAETGLSETSPVEIDINEAFPAETSLAEAFPAEVGLAEAFPAKTGIAETSPAKNGIAEAFPAKTGIAETSPAKNGIAEAFPAKTGIAETSPAKNGIAEAFPHEMDLAETCPAKTGIAEAFPAKTGTSEAFPTEIDSDETSPAKVGLPETSPAEVGIADTSPAKTGPDETGCVESNPEFTGLAENSAPAMGTGQDFAVNGIAFKDKLDHVGNISRVEYKVANHIPAAGDSDSSAITGLLAKLVVDTDDMAELIGSSDRMDCVCDNATEGLGGENLVSATEGLGDGDSVSATEGLGSMGTFCKIKEGKEEDHFNAEGNAVARRVSLPIGLEMPKKLSHPTTSLIPRRRSFASGCAGFVVSREPSHKFNQHTRRRSAGNDWTPFPKFFTQKSGPRDRAPVLVGQVQQARAPIGKLNFDRAPNRQNQQGQGPIQGQRALSFGQTQIPRAPNHQSNQGRAPTQGQHAPSVGQKQPAAAHVEQKSKVPLKASTEIEKPLSTAGLHVFNRRFAFCAVCCCPISDMSCHGLLGHLCGATHLAGFSAGNAQQEMEIAALNPVQKLWHKISATVGGVVFDSRLGIDSNARHWCEICLVSVKMSRCNVLEHVLSDQHRIRFNKYLKLK